MRIIHRNYRFHNTVSLFCSFENAHKQPVVFVLQKKCSLKYWKNLQKTTCAGVFFNKVRLANLIKTTSATVFSCEFFEITKETFFIKPVRATVSSTRKIPVIARRRYHFFSPLRFLILIDSILMDLAMEYRNFIFKPFTKERKNSLEFS